jgi:hypothetical protein
MPIAFGQKRAGHAGQSLTIKDLCNRPSRWVHIGRQGPETTDTLLPASYVLPWSSPQHVGKTAVEKYMPGTAKHISTPQKETSEDVLSRRYQGVVTCKLPRYLSWWLVRLAS